MGRELPAALIVVGAVSAAGGVAMTAKGAYDRRSAIRRIKRAGTRRAEHRAALDTRTQLTNEVLKSLGGAQADALHSVVERMASFIRRHQKQVAESEKWLVDGLEASPTAIALAEGLEQDAVAWMRGLLGSAVAGLGVNAGLTAAVTSFASAGTGAAISGLSGAAATNATMAVLGGGPVAAGGGGMALGAVALNAATVGPAALVAGFVVASQGEKALTQAAAEEAKVNEEIAAMDLAKANLDVIEARALELSTLLKDLVTRALEALNVLESEEFDKNRHGARFHSALTLTVAVRDVALAQIVDEDGKLGTETGRLTVKYRTLREES